MTSDGKLEFSMLCEFRNPPGWERPFRERYHDAIDHIVWAEEIGFDCIYFTEHHFADDDYLTAPLMNAAIVADRTKRIKIATCVLLLPLYNPVRLAEEGFHAPLDLVDGAARVYDPIVQGEAGIDLYGVFLKDYRPSNW